MLKHRILSKIKTKRTQETADGVKECDRNEERDSPMSAPESWKAAYRELIETLVRMGYPEELGKAIAKNLGSEKTMRRMTAYLRSAKPRSAEEIVDEMLAIMSDRERWIRKKEAEEANARYNELLYYGIGENEEDD